MDLLNMTNRAQKFKNFIRGLIGAIFIFQTTVLNFGDLLEGWRLATNAKFQLNISKTMPASA